MTVRVLIAAAAACALASGCGTPGISTYNIHPYYEPATGQEVCCAAEITSGRDVSSATVDVTKTADNTVTVHFTETGVVATAPIAAVGKPVASVADALGDFAVTAGKYALKP